MDEKEVKETETTEENTSPEVQEENTVTETTTEESVKEETTDKVSEQVSDKVSEQVEESAEKEEEVDTTLPDTNPKEATVEQATDVLKGKGFDYAELQKEFAEKGEISTETREKLAKVGITGEIVDNYIEGQKAKVERELDEISQCIGGREQLNEIIAWSAKNLSDEEKASINGITDANVMKIVLKDLKNRMEEKEGKIPEGTISGEGGQPAVEIYESQAQMFEAIRDPRYKKDEAYRAKVLKKIQASREAGIDLGI